MSDEDHIEDVEYPDRKPTTPEEQEHRMIGLAVEMAERQLAEGTASVPVLTHYLKLATVRESKEREKIELENELLRARTERIASEAKSEQMYEEAIKAFRSYSPNGGGDVDG